ncbi:hypothetical protein KNP414_00544 [Paenibacillus mucilaginosus KNP414]|uniref:Uncharacterized protein n=1 Tax=Paenibacillus mucilaginosus (strain KNP414) TaxID=1036673 RepID=F8FQ27_PAEMK|nr:hypothetical protein KNP414_00544 [Paenibacillus mucilaginosus KNP414]
MRQAVFPIISVEAAVFFKIIKKLYLTRARFGHLIFLINALIVLEGR